MFDLSKSYNTSIILAITAVSTVAALQWKDVIVHIISIYFPTSDGEQSLLTKIFLAIGITFLSIWLNENMKSKFEKK